MISMREELGGRPCDITQDGDKINLNFLMSDGNMHYAFSHYDDKPMYMLGRTKGYGGAILLSTQKVTDENWQEIGTDRLLAITSGEVLVHSDQI